MSFSRNLQELNLPARKEALSRRRSIVASVATLAASTAIAVPASLSFLTHPPKPSGETPAQVVELTQPNASPKPVLEVKINEGGNISHAVSVIAKAEGDNLDNSAIVQGINTDSHAIADQISAVPGGEVNAETVFYLHPDKPIVYPTALASDLTESITELK